MSNSGTWAGTSQMDREVTLSRPESLQLSHGTTPGGDAEPKSDDFELPDEFDEKCSLKSNESFILTEPEPFTYEQFTRFNLLLYKVFGEVGLNGGMAERQELAHAISLMTELGEGNQNLHYI